MTENEITSKIFLNSAEILLNRWALTRGKVEQCGSEFYSEWYCFPQPSQIVLYIFVRTVCRQNSLLDHSGPTHYL
jgi:hypothetical protein